MDKKYWGGIEGGGTKFNCIVGRAPGEIISDMRIDTTTPIETVANVVEFFQRAKNKMNIGNIGFGSFGPVDLNPNSATYGYITDTPKEGWSNVDILEMLRAGLNVPLAFDTDVNVAALGEHRWGAAQGLDTFVYLTIGTGIGGGGLVNGQMMHGMQHPEMGHMRIPHDRVRDSFVGNCKFHEDCFEGLASGPAMKKRWGRPAQELPNAHEAWALEAHYIALGIVNIILTLSPQRIILGGGVMQHAELIYLVRQEVFDLLKGYVRTNEILENLAEYIVPPVLGDYAGRWGAIALAQQAVIIED